MGPWQDGAVLLSLLATKTPMNKKRNARRRRGRKPNVARERLGTRQSRRRLRRRFRVRHLVYQVVYHVGSCGIFSTCAGPSSRAFSSLKPLGTQVQSQLDALCRARRISRLFLSQTLKFGEVFVLQSLRAKTRKLRESPVNLLTQGQYPFDIVPLSELLS